MNILESGKSKVILFVHGGPGLSSSYFSNHFETMRVEYDLAFYDQNYNFHSGNVIEHLCIQLKNNIMTLSEKYEELVVYAHSWGVFLYLNTLNICNVIKYKVSKTILANPAATTWNGFNESGDRLFARIPPHVMSEMSSCTDGVLFMEKALPYYLGESSDIVNIIIDKYDLDAYSKIERIMENYNISSFTKLLDPQKTYTIYCENDFENVSGSKELKEYSCVYLFKEAGHFPFAERQEEYIKLLLSILH